MAIAGSTAAVAHGRAGEKKTRLLYRKLVTRTVQRDLTGFGGSLNGTWPHIRGTTQV